MECYFCIHNEATHYLANTILRGKVWPTCLECGSEVIREDSRYYFCAAMDTDTVILKDLVRYLASVCSGVVKWYPTPPVELIKLNVDMLVKLKMIGEQKYNDDNILNGIGLMLPQRGDASKTEDDRRTEV